MTTIAQTVVAAWNADVMTISETQEYIEDNGIECQFTYSGTDSGNPAVMWFIDNSRALIANWEEPNLPGIYKVHDGGIAFIEVKRGNDYTVYVYENDAYLGHFQYQYSETGLSDMMPKGMVREFYLADIDVVKKYRGLGYGSHFLGIAKLQAALLGADGITLLVKSGMGKSEDQELRQFYLKNGFENFGIPEKRTMWFDLSKII